MRLDDLPGHEIVLRGLADVKAGRDTVESCLAKIGSPKLNDCGVPVHVSPEEALSADHRLYDLLALAHGDDARRRMNALLRELVSFERALEARHRRLTSAAPR